MKAAAFWAFGTPEVLTFTELETPQAGPGEVRVRVKTAGVQPADCAVRQGWIPPGAEINLPQIPGNEFAGTLEQLGEGVSGLELGDEVLGFRVLGCYAEYVVVPATQVVHKPATLPWEVAGGLTGAGQTAHIALEQLGVGAGDTVLIHAAAGAVGTIAVQLARLKGARVVGTASPANHAYLRELGAEPVSYGEGLVERVRALAPEGVTVALDAAGEAALRASTELVADRTRIGTIVAYGLVEELRVRAIRGPRSAARLSELVKLYEGGKLILPIRQTFPLERAADAHREVERGHGYGKVVLRVA